MTRTSEDRCFVATWQCSAPYCPFNCCRNPRSVLRVSSTSAVLATPRPQWLSRLWTAQRGDGRQVFQVRRRGAVAWLRCSGRCMSGWALSQKTFFSRGIHALPKRWNICMVCNGEYVEKWSHCVPFVFNKLRDKIIFKVFIWLTYVHSGVLPSASGISFVLVFSKLSDSNGRKTTGCASAFHDFLSPKSYIQMDHGSVRLDHVTSHLSTVDTTPSTIYSTGIHGIGIYHIRNTQFNKAQ